MIPKIYSGGLIKNFNYKAYKICGAGKAKRAERSGFWMRVVN
jgi:hypothetical protein